MQAGGNYGWRLKEGTFSFDANADAPGFFAKRVLGLGRDAAGEIYVLANDMGTPSGATGVVLRIDALSEEV